jgi:hypothetical protein
MLRDEFLRWVRRGVSDTVKHYFNGFGICWRYLVLVLYNVI